MAVIRRKRERAQFIFLIAVAAAAISYSACARHGEDRPAPRVESGSPVHAELLANTDGIIPGREFLLGVHFKIAPQWHIYWKDPGDAGMPTTVEWNLPPGFRAGVLLYPAPIRFEQPGDIVGYGYKDEVMLLAQVIPPAALPPRLTVTLRAHARWLACREQCILGDQQLELQLPPSAVSRSSRSDLFQKWLKRIPDGLEQAVATANRPRKRPFQGERHAPAHRKLDVVSSFFDFICRL